MRVEIDQPFCTLGGHSVTPVKSMELHLLLSGLN